MEIGTTYCWAGDRTYRQHETTSETLVSDTGKGNMTIELIRVTADLYEPGVPSNKETGIKIGGSLLKYHPLVGYRSRDGAHLYFQQEGLWRSN